MALREELENSGNWLFKWRSFLPLFTVVLFIISLKDFHSASENQQLDRTWKLFCLAISFLGLFFRVITVGSAPRGTSGRNTQNQAAAVLNTSGSYSLMRHPLYFGNFLIWIGIVLSVRSFWFSLASILIFWIYYERIMFAEEEFLRKKFEKDYLDWAERTPAFIPNFSHWRAPEQSIHWRPAIGSEYQGFLAIVATFSVLEFLQKSFAEKRLSLDPMWLGILITSVVIYSVLRWIKKKTTYLNKAVSN